MRTISNNDCQILERLIRIKQKAVKGTLARYLKKYYSEVIETDDFIIAEGDIPVALTAHMDTVWEEDRINQRELFYDKEKGMMWSPGGAGFDDKAGILAILKIIREGYKPHIILTTDEERGGIGAYVLTEKYPKSPFKDLRYVIELDRANDVDCVFYDCMNDKFTDYVESFGFIEALGSFSDIDIICSEWGIAGVNLSIGYRNEHTTSEMLKVNSMLSTIEKVKKMLKDAYNVEQFIYIPAPVDTYGKYFKSALPYNFDCYYDSYSFATCDKCHQHVSEMDIIPVKKANGKTAFYCGDCLNDDEIGWCLTCGEAYEKTLTHKQDDICLDCLKNKNGGKVIGN